MLNHQEKFLNPVHLRNRSLLKIRSYFEGQGLDEVITPTLVRSGGIEPFVDSISVDNEYYLPTSPEISLKKLLASQPDSCPGIYEIAHAFRNDLTGNHHLREFTMIEWYRKDLPYLNLIDDVLDIIRILSEIGKDFVEPINYRDSQIISVSDLFEKIFSIKPGSDWGFEKYYELALSRNIVQPIAKPKSEAEELHILSEVFTLLYDFAVLDFEKTTPGLFFIKEYPFFLRGMAKLSETGWAMRVEAYLNQLELCSGYQELDNAEELRDIWEKNNRIRFFADKKNHPIDEDLLRSTQSMKGVSGMALGLERVLMAVYKIQDIREFTF